MTSAPKYFVFDNKQFALVNEADYDKWHSEEWEKQEMNLFSKIIEGKVYTAQAFYNGCAKHGKKFMPFSIFYMEGTSHKVRYFKEWLKFQLEYKKLIRDLVKKENKQLISDGDKPSVFVLPCIASLKNRYRSKSIYRCTSRIKRSRSLSSDKASTICNCESYRANV